MVSYAAMSYTNYAVGRMAGGLEGCKPSKLFNFLAGVAHSRTPRQLKRQNVWRAVPPQTPPRKSYKL